MDLFDPRKMHRSPEVLTDPFFTDGTVDYDRVQGNNPLAGGEYPRMLYRHGGDEEVHGVSVSTRIVQTEDEQDALTADGWSVTPAKAARWAEQQKQADGEPPVSGRPPRQERLAPRPST